MVAVELGRTRDIRRDVESSRSGRTLGRTRLQAFPSRPWARWLVRVGFALPFLAIAFLAASTSSGLGLTVNADTVAHVQMLAWDRADAAWIGQLYPPLGTVLVRILPGGAVGLSAAGALVAGTLLQRLLEAMVQRRFRWWTVTVFLLAVGANPLFTYTATANFEAFLSIGLFGVGMMNMVRFISGRNTKAGFESGILFMLAALADSFGLVLVLVAAVTAPLLSLARKGETGARWSNVLIVLFPTIAVFVSVMFLQLVFLHDPFAVSRYTIDYDAALWAIVPHLFTTLDGFLLLAPVASGAALALLSRRPGAILIAVSVFTALILGYVMGLIPVNSAGNVFLIMTMMGIAVIPTARSARTSVLIAAVGAVQIVIAWTAAFNRPITLEWMGALVNTLGWG